MYYGKLKDDDGYGFDVLEDRFESYVEIDDETHTSIIRGSSEQNKKIVPDKDGYPILVDRDPPSEEEVKRQRIAELEGFLSDTDWYAIRFADTGEPIPAEIKQQRQDARDEISRLR